jgi:hypothetical protein
VKKITQFFGEIAQNGALLKSFYQKKLGTGQNFGI